MVPRHAPPNSLAPRLLLLAWVLLFPWVCPATAQDFNAQAKREVLDQLQNTLTHKAYVAGVRFSDWAAHEAKYFDKLDKARSPEAFASVVNAALSEFGVSHAALVPPSARAALRPSNTVSVGISVRPTDGGLRVLQIVPDSPAAASAIAPGDVITRIDGKPADNPDDLSGPANSAVTLRVRKTSGQTVEIPLRRRLIQARQPATLTLLDAAGKPTNPDAPRPAFGLLRLPTFAQDYSQPEIHDLFVQSMDLSGLIIDLRGNGGGAVANMLHFLSFMVIEETQIGAPISGELAARFVEATGNDPSDISLVGAWSPEKLAVPPNPIRPFPRPIVVLIDAGSASASELSSLALRELRQVVIVGRTSAGALLVSQYLPLPHDFLLQTPISDYVSIQGSRPEGVGVVPDVKVSSKRRREGLDPDLAAAINTLTPTSDPP